MISRANRKEFIETGQQQVRGMVERSNYPDPQKLKDARRWLYNQDHRYERLAFLMSVLAFVVALGALLKGVLYCR